MNSLFHSGVMIISFIGLWLASEKSIEYASTIAQFLGLSNLLIGFIVLSVATGLPELAIAIQALFTGEPTLSVGCILGANFSVVSLCLGSAAFFAGPFIIHQKFIRKSLVILFLSAFLMALVFSVGYLSRSFGLVLIGVYVAGIAWLWRNDALLKNGDDEKEKISERPKGSLFGSIVKFLLALIVLLIAAKLCVESALALALKAHVPLHTIGAVIIGVGASLPELSINIQAVRKKRYMFALGNSLGSVFEQGGLILGILSLGLSKPLSLDNFRYIVPFIFFAYVVIAYCLLFKQKIGLFEGFLLLFSYAAFLAYNVFFVIGTV